MCSLVSYYLVLWSLVTPTDQQRFNESPSSKIYCKLNLPFTVKIYISII